MKYQFIRNVKVSKSRRSGLLASGIYKKHTLLMEWSEGVWDSEKRKTNCLRKNDDKTGNC